MRCLFYARFLAATICEPNTSSIITSPTEIGKSGFALFIISIASAIFSFGIGVEVLTGSISPFLHFTVVVIVRIGATHSVSAYTFPLGQVLPVTDTTLPSQSSATRLQPIGQTIHVSSLLLFFNSLILLNVSGF